MGYDAKSRFYADPEPISKADVASASRTANGTSAAFKVEGERTLHAELSISAVAGSSPTLDVELETTVDGTNWHSVGAFPQKTVAGSDAKPFTGLGTQCRWKWSMTGTTPDFTFGIAVKALR